MLCYGRRIPIDELEIRLNVSCVDFPTRKRICPKAYCIIYINIPPPAPFSPIIKNIKITHVNLVDFFCFKFRKIKIMTTKYYLLGCLDLCVDIGHVLSYNVKSDRNVINIPNGSILTTRLQMKTFLRLQYYLQCSLVKTLKNLY